MRFLWFNVLFILACFASTQVGAGGFHRNTKEVKPEKFQKVLAELISKHFNLSLKYLFTGAAYENQRVQKPGMAKYLRELSDIHWKDGIETVKRYFKRGGKTDMIYNSAFDFKGKNELDMSLANTRNMNATYFKTLENLEVDAGICTDLLNRLHNISITNPMADWAYYFEEKVEKEEDRKRDIQGLITTLGKMLKSGLALNIFDSVL